MEIFPSIDETILKCPDGVSRNHRQHMFLSKVDASSIDRLQKLRVFTSMFPAPAVSFTVPTLNLLFVAV